jgi:hypothetical protein
VPEPPRAVPEQTTPEPPRAVEPLRAAEASDDAQPSAPAPTPASPPSTTQAPEHAPGDASESEHAAGEASETEHAPQPTPTATALAEPDLDAVRTLWPAVLDAVRADNGLLAACLAEAHPVEVRGSEVVVAFAEHDTFNRKMADGREHRATVDDALRGLAGSSLRVVFELRELEERSEAKPPSDDELVARFKTEFDAEEIVPDDPQPDEPGGQN